MLVKCPRCGGYGIIISFKHVDNGICFECEGAKVVEQAQAEKYIISEAKKDKNRALKLEKLEAYRKSERERHEKLWRERKTTKRTTTEQPQKPEIPTVDIFQVINEFLEEMDK